MILSQFIESTIAPPSNNVDFLGAQTRDDYFGFSQATHTFNYTRTAGTNDGLLVLVMADQATSGVTYDGVGLSQIDVITFNNASVSAWVGPDTLTTGSSEPVVITHAVSTDSSIGFAVGLEHFDAVDTIATGLTTSNSGNLTTSSLNLTPSNFSRCVDVIGKDGGLSLSLNGDAGQNGLFVNASSNNILGSASWNSVQDGSNVTLAHSGWTFGDDLAHLMFELKPK